MQNHQRVIYGTDDLSPILNEYGAGTVVLPYQSGEYLYIGQELPFNNFWLHVTRANAVAANLSIQIWWGNTWENAVDITDGTAASGKPLAQSGRISFRPRWDKNWSTEQRAEMITGLEDWEIYDMYWARLAWSATLTGNTTLKYLGQKFANDSNLYDFYPDLRNQSLRDAWQQASDTKTTWDEQHYAAADALVDDLIRRRLIEGKQQIVDWSIYRMAACHKAAEIIYQGLGTSYAEHKKAALGQYAQNMNKGNFRVDKDRDGVLSCQERRATVTYMDR